MICNENFFWLQHLLITRDKVNHSARQKSHEEIYHLPSLCCSRVSNDYRTSFRLFSLRCFFDRDGLPRVDLPFLRKSRSARDRSWTKASVFVFFLVSSAFCALRGPNISSPFRRTSLHTPRQHLLINCDFRLASLWSLPSRPQTRKGPV